MFEALGDDVPLAVALIFFVYLGQRATSKFREQWDGGGSSYAAMLICLNVTILYGIALGLGVLLVLRVSHRA